MRNFAEADPALRPLLTRYVGDMELLDPVLTDVGEVAAGELDALAATAEENPPRLRPFDRHGNRIDAVEFHPAYRDMSRLAFERFGFAAMSHRAGVHGWPSNTPHVVKYALSYVFVQSEFGLFCPVSMTDAAARVLRTFGDPHVFADEIAGLTSTSFDSLYTGAMFMTEAQAGSDVGGTATEARERGGHWRLHGHKWFASNVSADVILTLARVPNAPAGTRGLGMFMLPRHRPDGSRNAYRIERLKDKLGSRSMATGEVTVDGAYALPVGQLDAGFRQMAEMMNVSRLSNAMRAVALMRRGAHEAVTHARERRVFGRRLWDQPLLRRGALALLVHTEAALGWVLDTADLLDQADSGSESAARLARVLTPLAKYHLCRLARWATGEALEIRGGNGYVEEWVNPRLLRDAHLGSIWEGSSNVIALDVLRCVRKDNAHEVLVAELRGRLATAENALASSTTEAVAAAIDRTQRLGTELESASDERAQLGCADFADLAARTSMAALLLEQAVFEGSERKRIVAAAYVELCFGDGAGESTGTGMRDLDLIADGLC